MHISWLPSQFISLQGMLGLTHLPGGYQQSRDNDLEKLALQPVSHLIGLVEAEELQRMEPPETVTQRKTAVEQCGISFLHCPIEDLQAPTLTQAQNIVQYIQEALTHQENVVLHCYAGLGRAGTIAACFLVREGMSPHDAMQTVRWVRRGAIQTACQEQFIQTFAQHGTSPLPHLS